MYINKQYTWQSAEDRRENNAFLPRNLRGLVIGKSGCGKTTAIFNHLLQPGWLDYNHLYVFGKILHQQEYKDLRKGLEASDFQFIQQTRSLHTANISPLTAIEKFERYELTITMIVRIFQIHQHWTPHKRICCCWTIA